MRVFVHLKETVTMVEVRSTYVQIEASFSLHDEALSNVGDEIGNLLLH
jgi:hypothetical protein